MRHKRWKPGKNRRKAAPGTILLFTQVFYRPSVAHVVEARLQVDGEEADSGDPETTARQLTRQLRKIRRGEPLQRLTLRL